MIIFEGSVIIFGGRVMIFGGLMIFGWVKILGGDDIFCGGV